MTEAEEALDAELNRPWPDAGTSAFVSGCAQTPVEGLSGDENVALCECTVTELQESGTFVDFVTFSPLAYAEGDVATDPFTGLPEGIDRDSAEALVQRRDHMHPGPLGRPPEA